MLVVGPNGAGKTNLLESLHVGTQGFSPRTRNDASLIRFGREGARIALHGDRAGSPVELNVILQVGAAKRASLNGARLQTAEQLRGEVATLVFTPDRLVVVKGGPAARRAYFDRALGRGTPTQAVLPAVYGAALALRDAPTALGRPAHVKTTGSKGVHVYVPIVRGPTQKEVWTLAKHLAFVLAGAHPDLITAEYRIAKRPAGRVLVDYNQNAWGRTLASVYSPRPTPRATVSTPVTWQELADGASIADFRIDNVPARLAVLGDLWAPIDARRGRFDLSRLLGAARR